MQYVYILVTVKGMNTSETHLKRLLTNELLWPCLTAGQVLFTLGKIDGEPTQMRPEDPWIEDPWSEKLWAKDYWSYPSPATAVGQPAPLLHSTSSTTCTTPHLGLYFLFYFALGQLPSSSCLETHPWFLQKWVFTRFIWCIMMSWLLWFWRSYSEKWFLTCEVTVLKQVLFNVVIHRMWILRIDSLSYW